MRNRYDVIIIGAGIGGLICGTKLAKNGLKVLIIEKNKVTGGCASSYKRNGYTFDRGTHFFSGCGNRGVLRYFLDTLGIPDIDFIQLNPTDRFIFPDQIVEMPHGIDEYKSRLNHLYRNDINNIELFFKEAISISKSFFSSTLLNKYKNLTYEMLLKRYFTNEKLMSILSAQCGYLGTAPSKLAATAMCLTMISYVKDGSYYPKGGIQSLADTIAAKFKSLGGALLCEHEVKKINMRSGIVSGVEIDGDNFESSAVVSNGDARNTLMNLITGKELGATYRNKLYKMRPGSSFFMLYLGVKGDIDLKDKSGWYHFKYGLRTKPDQSLLIFVPSLVDRSIAPRNRQIVRITMPSPIEFVKVKSWRSVGKELESKMLDSIEKIVNGLKSSIDIKDYATPKSIEQYTLNTEGSICGWEMSVDQMHDNRLMPTTPINGLYLVGHWTNPGSGIPSVATSGWVVADMIIRDRAGKGIKNAAHVVT